MRKQKTFVLLPRVPGSDHSLSCCCRMMWAAGTVAAMSSITFPAVSALVSQNAESDQQGEVVVLAVSTFSWDFPAQKHEALSSHIESKSDSPVVPARSIPAYFVIL